MDIEKINWSIIPDKLGVYWLKNKQDEVVLVSKTKNIKKSMKKYFSKEITPEQKILISNIFSYGYKVFQKQSEAIKLEEKLIKEHTPKFNLKTNTIKNSPYIEIKNCKTNKIAKVTNLFKNKKSYFFGPFKDASYAKKIIQLLSYVGLLEEPNYGMETIINFFSGNINDIKDKIHKINDEYSESYLNLCNDFLNQRKKIFNDEKDRDIFNFYGGNGVISISIMNIRKGRLWLIYNFINKDINPDINSLFETFINTYYKNRPVPELINVPFNFEWNLEISNKIIFPKNKKSLDLLEYLENNAIFKLENNMGLLSNKLASFQLFSKFFNLDLSKKTYRFTEMIDFKLEKNKINICFAMFDNGIFQKKISKTYNIDNDVDLYELVQNHLKEKIKNNKRLPDLVILPEKKFLPEINKIINKFNLNTKILSMIIDSNNNVEGLETEKDKFFFLENTEINLLINKMRTILVKEILRKSGRLKWED